jgi:predicted DNA-binding transcriptional regulator YafY
MSHPITIRRLPLRSVRTRSGRQFPTTVSAETPTHDFALAEVVYRCYNGGRVPAETLSFVMGAVYEGAAVVVSYLDAKGEMTARVLWPSSVTLTHENHLTAWCYCTLRRAWQSFRLDRIQTIHPLTSPDDGAGPDATAEAGGCILLAGRDEQQALSSA